MSAAKDTWSAESYNKTAPFVYSPAYTASVLSLLGAKPGERIFDFGCGSGELTLQIQNIVSQTQGGVVIGVDASESMINKSRSNGIKHAFVCDVQNLQFPNDWDSSFRGGFDAVFSNAALHWCKRDPAGVLESAKKILKPGGRIVVEMGGHMNCIGLRSALHAVLRRRGYDSPKMDPWFFPSIEEYRQLLDSSGFTANEIGLYPRLTTLSGSLYDWLQLFARESFLSDVSDAEADEILKETEQMCEVDSKDAAGNWSIMYCRLRFAATLNG